MARHLSAHEIATVRHFIVEQLARDPRATERELFGTLGERHPELLGDLSFARFRYHARVVNETARRHAVAPGSLDPEAAFPEAPPLIGPETSAGRQLELELDALERAKATQQQARDALAQADAEVGRQRQAVAALVQQLVGPTLEVRQTPPTAGPDDASAAGLEQLRMALHTHLDAHLPEELRARIDAEIERHRPDA
jgi:hypothetical protein